MGRPARIRRTRGRVGIPGPLRLRRVSVTYVVGSMIVFHWITSFSQCGLSSIFITSLRNRSMKILKVNQRHILLRYGGGYGDPYGGYGGYGGGWGAGYGGAAGGKMRGSPRGAPR